MSGKPRKSTALGCVLSFCLFLAVAVEARQGQPPSWEKGWEETIAAAEQEGELVYHAGSTSEPVFREFQKKYPRIKAIRMLTRGGSAAVQRVMAERRAGVYATDVLVIGGTSALTLADARILDPIEPVLILPDIVNRSNWWEHKHHYVDRENRYLFMYAAQPQPDVGYNTKLVDPGELTSYWDLVDPKWKGKIVALDPAQARGGAGSAFRFLYYSPELGPNLIRRLLSEMDLTSSRDGRQITDWLAGGRFAISVFTSPGRTGLDTAKEQKLPVNWFPPGHFKEGVPLSGGANNVVLVNRAPHPHAAALFINWLLSQEGQSIAQKVAGDARVGVDSLRIDIAKDDVPPDYRRHEGVKYFYTDRPEWMDMEPIMKLIDEVWKRK